MCKEVKKFWNCHLTEVYKKHNDSKVMFLFYGEWQPELRRI